MFPLNECCLNLLTAIGLEAMYPERADQLRAGVSLSRERSVPPAARHAIIRGVTSDVVEAARSTLDPAPRPAALPMQVSRIR